MIRPYSIRNALYVLSVMVHTVSVVLAYECGNLQFKSNTVLESGSAELVYSYAAGNRYAPRLWYRVQDQRWTKLFDSTHAYNPPPKYRERFRDNTFVLTISPVAMSDFGTYVVLCATERIKQSQTAELKVLPSAAQPGLCGRLSILSNGLPVGTYVQFRFDSDVPQYGISWQRQYGDSFKDLGVERGVELTENVDRTVFGRKLYSSSSDVGMYRVRCRDGSFSNIVELAVHVISPGKPVILNTQSFPGCEKCLLATAGTNLHISCWSYNGSAPVDLKLYLNNKKINSAVSTDVIGRRVNVEKRLLVYKTDENAVIKCSAINSAIDTPISTDVRVYLFKEPAPPRIITFSGVEGKPAQITCTSTGGKPAPILSFTYNGTSYVPKPTHTVNKDGTIRVDSAIYVNLTRSDNLRTVQCTSTSRHSKQSVNKHVVVKFPPREVTVNRVSQTSDITGVTLLTVRCTTGESNPTSSVIWQGLDAIKRATNTNGNESVVSNGGKVFYHDLTMNLTRKDNNKKIKCLAMNTDFPDLVLETVYRINIPYQPIVSLVEGPNITVHEGSDVTVTCRVDSNPRSRLRWSKDGLTLIESNGEMSLKLTWYNITMSDDSSVLTCSANNGIGKGVTVQAYIFVKEKSLAIQGELRADSHVKTIVGVLCLVFSIVGVVIIVVFVIRRRRKMDNNVYPASVQIRIEDRQPSIHPPVEEPVYNNLAPQDTAGTYIETTEYARVIPRSQRNPHTGGDNSAHTAEYAAVIPKSQRVPAELRTGVQQNRNYESSSGLVYADLDLTFTNEGNPQKRPAFTQKDPATQYVTIDFIKTNEINENQQET